MPIGAKCLAHRLAQPSSLMAPGRRQAISILTARSWPQCRHDLGQRRRWRGRELRHPRHQPVCAILAGWLPAPPEIAHLRTPPLSGGAIFFVTHYPGQQLALTLFCLHQRFLTVFIEG
jgi:hypothetical protein